MVSKQQLQDDYEKLRVDYDRQEELLGKLRDDRIKDFNKISNNNFKALQKKDEEIERLKSNFKMTEKTYNNVKKERKLNELAFDELFMVINESQDGQDILKEYFAIQRFQRNLTAKNDDLKKTFNFLNSITKHVGKKLDCDNCEDKDDCKIKEKFDKSTIKKLDFDKDVNDDVDYACIDSEGNMRTIKGKDAKEKGLIGLAISVPLKESQTEKNKMNSVTTKNDPKTFIMHGKNDNK